jgi:hypothetical protein
MGPRGSFLGVKRPGREADHSPLVARSNAWNYTSTPQYIFMAWYSVKAQGQLYLIPLDSVMYKQFTLKFQWGLQLEDTQKIWQHYHISLFFSV